MKKFLILILAASVGLSSCLDKTPLSQMSPDTFFSNANELEAFSNTFYTMFPAEPVWTFPSVYMNGSLVYPISSV